MKIKFYSPRSAAIAALWAVVLWASSQPVPAGTIYTYTTPANATNNGEPVSAKVVLTISNDLINVQLSDTSTSINDMGQVLTGVTISLSGKPTGGSVATGASGSSADVVYVGSGGTVYDYGINPIFGKETIYDPYTNTFNKYDGWTIGDSTSSSDLSVFGTGGPNFGVLDSQTSYSSNGSIANNSPHNPFSRGTATFNVTYTGNSVTTATKVTGVVFQFGTNQNAGTTSSNFVPAPVPEPTSLALWSAALVAVGYRRFRKRTINSKEEVIS